MPDGLVLKEHPGLTREQKIGFFLLLLFAILAVALGFLQIRNTMYRPFALNNEIPSTLRRQVDDIEALRYRDTDRDGIMDFDEQYVFGTSAYLADSDSDGATDKQEVDRRTNPLCPEGQDCGQYVIEETADGKLTAVSGTSSLNLGVDEPGEPPPDLNKVLSDPAQLRAMLLQVGMSKERLDKVSDSDLLKIASEVINVTASTTLEAARLPSAPAVPAP